ncbi:MAG: hypothetical protein AAF675_00595 [Pseudomonadota bacterium]
MSEIDDIQARYVEALRAVEPEIRAWWDGMMAAAEDPAEVRLRWPTGPAAHPRVLAIFRDFFFEIEDFNARQEASYEDDRTPPPGEAGWGVEDLGEAPELARQVDWLIVDIEEIAPELFDLVEGIVYVPIAWDANEVLV